jgi:6-phosphogluconolactonase
MAPQIERQLIVLDDFAREAAEHIAALRPRTLVLTGGETPRAVYEQLSKLDLPWPEIDIFFGDERCVPPDHVDSNFGMAQTALLSKVEAKVHRMPGETCDPQQYDDELSAVFGPGVPTFDLVLHGLGEDGHTASLFPKDPALNVTDRRVVRVERSDHARLTLTLPVLSSAKAGIFLVSGASKQWALRQLLDGSDIPAARIRAERLLVLADRAAAGSFA